MACLDEAVARHDVVWRWVQGHAGIWRTSAPTSSPARQSRRISYSAASAPDGLRARQPNARLPSTISDSTAHERAGRVEECHRKCVPNGRYAQPSHIEGAPAERRQRRENGAEPQQGRRLGAECCLNDERYSGSTTRGDCHPTLLKGAEELARKLEREIKGYDQRQAADDGPQPPCPEERERKQEEQARLHIQNTSAQGSRKPCHRPLPIPGRGQKQAQA
jgi:hypothetical protein